MDVRALVEQTALKHGVDPKIALAVAQAESNFNPNVKSHAGAIGVMQLMPGTAKGLGVDPYNVNQNIDGGIRYLKQQYDNHGNDWKLALAAYNAGPGNVKKYGGVPPFSETQNYIQKILGGGLTPSPSRGTPTATPINTAVGRPQFTQPQAPPPLESLAENRLRHLINTQGAFDYEYKNWQDALQQGVAAIQAHRVPQLWEQVDPNVKTYKTLELEEIARHNRASEGIGWANAMSSGSGSDYDIPKTESERIALAETEHFGVLSDIYDKFKNRNTYDEDSAAQFDPTKATYTVLKEMMYDKNFQQSMHASRSDTYRVMSMLVQQKMGVSLEHFAQALQATMGPEDPVFKAVVGAIRSRNEHMQNLHDLEIADQLIPKGK